MSNKFDAITQCLDYILNETLLGATQSNLGRIASRMLNVTDGEGIAAAKCEK